MRENREKNDLVTKNFEIFPDVAADIINALLHNGKLVVTKENLLPAPTESIYTSGENRLRNQLQDVVKYEMAGERIRAQYMIANQSAPDVKMVLRKAGYTGGGYREQYEGKVMDWAVSSFASESRVKIGVLVVSFGIIVSPFKL